MLGFCIKIKETSEFFQVMGVCSMFVGFVTELCSPSDVCVWSVDTRVHTQSSLSVFTTLGTAVCLHCTLVWLFIRETRLSSPDPILALALTCLSSA